MCIGYNILQTNSKYDILLAKKTNNILLCNFTLSKKETPELLKAREK